ncbi:hypothetical protein CMT42_15430 [Elizabethkingia anophelis]|uniref:Phage protein n=2 Tax=Elizabethkingia anophelis TaxID=1117645 RepID=A0A494J1Z6_9FLAO|nr:hypothetical protein [Elizabethkingia anophelis]AQX52530.1 hypothetical protein AYC66_18410 [Elizabethkingia anophelis]MCT3800618.1 hypothetical protein [Elizabethkingia anophelis]MCT3835907.1 hypothetical protein [Elizabethkingia anophelis]MCT3926910.1 hypothetical protein [Elizabethkingia anophelis]MCT3978723.1 hypothetical protein [Elizabethkingia anophelis]
MEAKDKAIDLKVKFMEMIPNDIIRDDKVAAELARVNAMVCVVNLIETSDWLIDSINGEKCLNYWQEVKQELENLK